MDNAAKMPVFDRQPIGEQSLEHCLGWVSDHAQACELLLKSRSVIAGIDMPGIGKLVFGGVVTGQIRIATDNGPHRDREGLYRWQTCLYPFFDTAENLGKPTPLNNVYIYQPADKN
jgi:hypothetical protein